MDRVKIKPRTLIADSFEGYLYKAERLKLGLGMEIEDI